MNNVINEHAQLMMDLNETLLYNINGGYDEILKTMIIDTLSSIQSGIKVDDIEMESIVLRTILFIEQGEYYNNPRVKMLTNFIKEQIICNISKRASRVEFQKNNITHNDIYQPNYKNVFDALSCNKRKE